MFYGGFCWLQFFYLTINISLHTVMGYQVFLYNTNNLCTVIWFQVFLSNTNNLYRVIRFQVTISI